MKSYHSCFLFSKYSSSETKSLAENFRTQWPGGDTKPVHVTGDMEKYLTTEATKEGLGGFNKHDLIAATFVKKNRKGRIFLGSYPTQVHISRKLKKRTHAFRQKKSKPDHCRVPFQFCSKENQTSSP